MKTVTFRRLASHRRNLSRTLPLALLTLITPLAQAVSPDHTEFEATLQVPFRAQQGGNEARSFTLNFDYPGAAQAQAVAWRVQLKNPKGKVVQSWYGIDALRNKALNKTVTWAGRRSGMQLADGLYQVELEAVALLANPTLLAATPELTVPGLLTKPGAELIKQSWPTQIGNLAQAAMPRFASLPTGAVSNAIANKYGRNSRLTQAMVKASAALPYTVYYGNLHSQTNHSDGGGDVSGCSHAVAPQKGAYGPAEAYAYAKGKGLDFLMTSEHNHLFDGNSSNTNAAALPATAKALYQSGVTAAASFNANNPGFLALYGMEWGVISNGGHMNIFGSKELFAWEYNGNKQLIGDVLTPKTDYAAMYTLMKSRNLIGQFNHPTTSGQFLIGSKALGYTADGDSVMALCEVANASAFSNTTDESDTNIDTFESACNRILENGFHVAFSSNQDNHCANWGASSTNRTGVLIPTGTAISDTSFQEAIRARRVFATMDKNSQLILTANGRLMGERFNNTGALTLTANFASSTGRTVASVQLIEGVPGSSGSTALLAETATATITPTTGAHYYYAKVTQDDGKILWSAPVWVTQGAGGPVDNKDLIVNGGFENKTTGWTAAPGIITTKTGQSAHGGKYKAWMNGYGAVRTDTLAQTVTLPAALTSAQLSFWLSIDTEETVTTVIKDTLSLKVKDSTGKVLATLGNWSNLDKGAFKNLSFDLTSYKGKTVQLFFEGIENGTKQTSFVIDDVSLIAK